MLETYISLDTPSIRPQLETLLKQSSTPQNTARNTLRDIEHQKETPNQLWGYSFPRNFTLQCILAGRGNPPNYSHERTYERVVENAQRQDQSLTDRIHSWLAKSQLAVMIEELQVALGSVQEQPKGIHPSKWDRSKSLFQISSTISPSFYLFRPGSRSEAIMPASTLGSTAASLCSTSEHPLKSNNTSKIHE